MCFCLFFLKIIEHNRSKYKEYVKEQNKTKQIGIERVENIKSGEIKSDKSLKCDKFIEAKLATKSEFTDSDYKEIGMYIKNLKMEDFN